MTNIKYIMWFVYIIKSLKCKWYYVGSTNRLEKRIKEHNQGKSKATKPFVPFIPIFTRKFDCETDARNYEQKLKKCRKEKEKIIKEYENKIKK